MTCSLQHNALGRASPADNADSVHCSAHPAAKSAAADKAGSLATPGRHTGATTSSVWQGIHTRPAVISEFSIRVSY